MKKTLKQAQTTIEKIVKRYDAESMRVDLNHILTSLQADDASTWEAICGTSNPPNFGCVDADEAWEVEHVCASFYEELTGRVAAFVVCVLSHEGEALLGDVINGGGEGSIQALLTAEQHQGDVMPEKCDGCGAIHGPGNTNTMCPLASNYMGDANLKEIVAELEASRPRKQTRIETGSVQFGDDWPGAFIRGDDCHNFSMHLDAVLNTPGLDELSVIVLRGLQSTLGSSDVHANGRDRQYLLPYAECVKVPTP